MKKYQAISSVSVCLVAAALAGCGTVGTYQSSAVDFNNRFYVGAGVLISDVEPGTDQVEGDGVSVDDSRSSGGSLALGYDISNRFSIEGHLADLGEATLNPEGSVSYQVGGLSALIYGLGAASDRDNRESFSLFGRLGVGGLNNDSDGVRFERVNNAHLLAGVGVEYGFDNGLAARAEIVAHETDAKYAQLGLVYRFGDSSSQRSSAAIDSTAEPATLPPVPDDSAAAGTEAEAMSEPKIEQPAIVETLDADNDGVADGDDQCDQTPPGSPVNESGCEIFNGVIEGVNFQTGSATLTDDALGVLKTVADVLLKNPEVKVTIEAHTDNAGDAGENLQLSKRRAIAVARYLVDEGVSGERLRPQAFGESEPRSTNDTVQGRAANRRVEFSIFR